MFPVFVVRLSISLFEQVSWSEGSRFAGSVSALVPDRSGFLVVAETDER